jgi:hypothetical protein
MGEIKPLGSEKLTGDAKLKRILELTYYNTNTNNIQENKNIAEYVVESVNGFYGIVKEKDGYYVKKGLTENTLDYIGGLFMKKKNRFRSYGEALKRLDLLKGGELLSEDTKYVLKVNKPKVSTEGEPTSTDIDALKTQAANMPSDTGSAPPASSDPGLESGIPEEPSGEELPPSEEMPEPEAGEDGSEPDQLKVIQKITGKLGQKLRAYQEKMESDDIKYVINSVLSALDLTKLEDADKEEIISNFEGEEEGGEEEFSSEEEPTDMEPGSGSEFETPENPEEEFGEGIDALEELINTPIEDYDDDSIAYSEEPVYGSMEAELDLDDYINQQSNAKEIEADEQFPYVKSKPANVDKNFPFSKARSKRHSINKELSETNSDPYQKEVKECDKSKPYKKEIKEVGKSEPYDKRVKEIELDELTTMINNTVKETLSKYFE